MDIENFSGKYRTGRSSSNFGNPARNFAQLFDLHLARSKISRLCKYRPLLLDFGNFYGRFDNFNSSLRRWRREKCWILSGNGHNYVLLKERFFVNFRQKFNFLLKFNFLFRKNIWIYPEGVSLSSTHPSVQHVNSIQIHQFHMSFQQKSISSAKMCQFHTTYYAY